MKTLLESYLEARDDFIEALNISPTNLRARYQKLINDAKIGNKENKPQRVEQAISSFEEYYDTCKNDIYYALALISVNKIICIKLKTNILFSFLFVCSAFWIMIEKTKHFDI